MDFEKIKQIMTKEEFLDSALPYSNDCPGDKGLKSETDWLECDYDCQECWENAIEINNVKFAEDKTEEQKVVEALKVVSDYCVGKDCSFCKFGIYRGSDCIICEELGSECPSYWDVKPIEDIIKPKVTIYDVVHKEEGKHYSFISDEKLSLWDMVVCDTSQGKSYGRIIEIRKDIDDEYKKCWKVK